MSGHFLIVSGFLGDKLSFDFVSGEGAMHPAGMPEGDQVGGSEIQGLVGSQNDIFEKARHIKNVKDQTRKRRSSIRYSIVDHNAEETPVQEQDRDDIKNGMKIIYNLWRDISLGADQVSTSLLSSICDNIGEIGSELFIKIFLNRCGPQQFSAKEFWGLWMKFLSDEAFNSEIVDDSDRFHTDSGRLTEKVFIESSHQHSQENVLGCFELILSQYSPNRRLRHLFFGEQALVKYLLKKQTQ